MLAIYSLPLGLLAAGALIERIGFSATATLYAAVGPGVHAADRAALARRALAFGRECHSFLKAQDQTRKRAGLTPARSCNYPTLPVAVAVMAMMVVPAAAEIQADARTVAVAAVVGITVTVVVAVEPAIPSAAVHVPAVTPATAAPPDVLRESILIAVSAQTFRSAAERRRLGADAENMPSVAANAAPPTNVRLSCYLSSSVRVSLLRRHRSPHGSTQLSRLPRSTLGAVGVPGCDDHFKAGLSLRGLELLRIAAAAAGPRGG